MRSERDALRGVIGGVLCNANNFPEKVAPRILGQDMGPLIDQTADAILDAGYTHRPRAREHTLDLEFTITEAQNWHTEAGKGRMTPQMMGMLQDILSGKVKRPDTPEIT